MGTVEKVLKCRERLAQSVGFKVVHLPDISERSVGLLGFLNSFFCAVLSKVAPDDLVREVSLNIYSSFNNPLEVCSS